MGWDWMGSCKKHIFWTTNGLRCPTTLSNEWRRKSSFTITCVFSIDLLVFLSLSFRLSFFCLLFGLSVHQSVSISLSLSLSLSLSVGF